MQRGRPEPGRNTSYASALQRLARRDHSESEIRGALARDGYSEHQIEEAVRRLRSARYLDDAGFAERFARSRSRNLGQGSRRIRAALASKGVGREAAETGLREALDEVSEGATLDETARRYWRQKTAEDPRRRLRKLWGFLLRRGFSADLVAERLQALWPRWKDVLSEMAEGETGEA